MNLEDALLRDVRASQPLATDVAEGSLFYVTDESITEQSRGGVWVSYSGPAGSTTAIDELTGDVTAVGPGVVAATITNDAVTYAKMQNVSAASKLIGRGSAGGSGNPEEITLGTGLSMTGTTLDASGAAINQLTGDVTAGPGSGSQAATIANNAVTYAKMQDISAASRILGRGSAGGAGDTQELTIGSGLSITGTVLDATGGGGGITALTGDVTASGSGSVAATIANNAVTTAKILDANVTLAKIVDASVASVLLGRGSASGSGDFQEITLGSGLSMASQVLSATGGGGGGTGGGALVWLARRTGATSSSLDFTSLITSVYDEYVFVINTLLPTSSTDLYMQVSANNGSSYDTTGSNYRYARGYGNQAAFSSADGGASTPCIVNLGTVDNSVVFGGLNATIRLYNPLNASGWTAADYQGSYRATDTNNYRLTGSGWHLVAAAQNAVRFIYNASTIASGTIDMYGVTKTAGGTGSAALSGSNLGALASANLSTLGTIDWFAMNSNLTVPAGQSAPATKITGTGDIRESLFSMNPSPNIFTNASGVTMSCTAGDGTTGTLSSTSFVGQIGGVGTGWRFRVKAKMSQQRLTIYTIAFSCEYTVTATMSDGSATPVTITVNTGAASGGGRIIEFLFTASAPDVNLQIVIIQTINLGSSPNVGLCGISLGV